MAVTYLCPALYVSVFHLTHTEILCDSVSFIHLCMSLFICYCV